MGISQYLANKLIDHQLGKTAYTMPTVYVGVSSTTPTTLGTNVTEPSGGSYARIATSGASWNAAASGATTNATALQFAQATADWVSGANLTHVVLYDALTTGNFLGFGAVAVPKNALTGDTLGIPIDGVTVTLS
jgi:hypothetical protein